MTLRQKQSRFAWLISQLIEFAYDNGYELTFACAYHPVWKGEIAYHHSESSFHKKRLAFDLNLFKDGEWQTTTKAHKPLGEYWKSLDPECVWGGDFGNPDGNHYQYSR